VRARAVEKIFLHSEVPQFLLLPASLVRKIEHAACGRED
jgi:hypothetical protein